MNGATSSLEGARAPSSLPPPALLVATFALSVGAWWLAGRLWSVGARDLAGSVFGMGLALGPCLAGYLGVPRHYRPLLLRIVLVTGGLAILAPRLAALDVASLVGLLSARG